MVRLRGASRSPSFRSDVPHAGLWSRRTAYVCVPNVKSPQRVVAAALSFDPSLKDRSGDSDVLLMGSLDAIGKLIAAGPVRLRAMKKRKVDPSRAAHLLKT